LRASQAFADLTVQQVVEQQATQLAERLATGSAA
jgi:hypothetical protein